MPAITPTSGVDGSPPLVAVTGASGYIGSHVVAELLRRGYRVRAVVRDASNQAKVAHLKALPAGAGQLDTLLWYRANHGECWARAEPGLGFSCPTHSTSTHQYLVTQSQIYALPFFLFEANEPDRPTCQRPFL